MKSHDLPSTNPLSLSLNGAVVTIDLEAGGVPLYASEVIVFTRVRTQFFNTGGFGYDGFLIVQSGTVQRKLFFSMYDKSVWVYNSDYLYLPLSQDRNVTAWVARSTRIWSKNFYAEVQLVGHID